MKPFPIEMELTFISGNAKLLPDLRVGPPENLEGNSNSCYFRFSRAADLRRHVEYLQQRLRAGTFDRLLDTLNDEASGKE